MAFTPPQINRTSAPIPRGGMNATCHPSPRDTLYQLSVQPWEQRPTNSRAMNDRRISPSGGHVPSPSQRSFTTHSERHLHAQCSPRPESPAQIPPDLPFLSPSIQRTTHAQSRLLHHMSVNLRRLHITMSQQALHRADVYPSLQQMCCKTMP